MKREGRQHGFVRCYGVLPSSRPGSIKMVDPASATGLFTKVSKKPTNLSKFTGKCPRPRCAGCHVHPACKSRDKAKGTMKLRSIDSQSDRTKYPAGTSATGILAYLADEGSYGYNDDDYDYEDTVDDNYSYAYANHQDHDDGTRDIDLWVGFKTAASVAAEELENDVDVADDDQHEDDDDDRMSFCDVGLCWGHGDGDEYGDDGWYLVGVQMQ